MSEEQGYSPYHATILSGENLQHIATLSLVPIIVKKAHSLLIS